MIQKTRDYSIFKKHPLNRNVDTKHVKKLVKEMRLKSLLHVHPIIVDGEMRIIDGGHRFEAAVEIGLEVYYIVDPNAIPQDIRSSNQHSLNWSREDYFIFCCKEGRQEYLKLKKFMEKNGITLNTALGILGQAGGGRAGKRTEGFRGGTFRFPTEHSEEQCYDILRKSKLFIEYLSTKIIGGKRYLNSPKFLRALYIFLSQKTVDLSLFIERLTLKMELVRPCVTMSNYLTLFATIYNYRNRNPIDLGALAEK